MPLFKVMRFWQQLVLIPLLALVCTGASALWTERPSLETLQTDAWMRTPAEVAAMGDVLWVDARSADAFAQDHIEGAVNVSLNDWDTGFGEFVGLWLPDNAVIVYCDGEGCQLSRETAERLRQDLGDDRVYWLEGGIEAWRKLAQ